MLALASLAGRRVRAYLACPVFLDGFDVIRLDGVFGGVDQARATFCTHTFTLHTISHAIDAAGHDVTIDALLFYATATVDLRYLAALELDVVAAGAQLGSTAAAHTTQAPTGR
jgi:hypothetical protein